MERASLWERLTVRTREGDQSAHSLARVRVCERVSRVAHARE